LEELVAEQSGTVEKVQASQSPVEDEMPEKLTAACVWIMRKYAAEESIGTGKVKAFLIRHGFDTGGKNFNIILMKTLKRLVDSDRVDGAKVDGNWAFRSKPQSP
jgi:hypothetical protein